MKFHCWKHAISFYNYTQTAPKIHLCRDVKLRNWHFAYHLSYQQWVRPTSPSIPQPRLSLAHTQHCTFTFASVLRARGCSARSPRALSPPAPASPINSLQDSCRAWPCTVEYKVRKPLAFDFRVESFSKDNFFLHIHLVWSDRYFWKCY